jgi:FHS family glucose/mannose:H+ symporter-like MFS transporter
VSSPASSRLEQAGESPVRPGAPAHFSLLAFFLCGISMSFLGAILPAWRYHLEAGFTEAGDYFLSLALGFLLSAASSQSWLSRKSLKFILVLANSLACGGFLFLAFASPPAPPVWRLLGVLWIGVSAGLLSAGMFQAVAFSEQRNLALTTNLAGVFFGFGCLLTALLVAGTYFVYTVPSILILLALLPGFSAVWYARSTLPRAAAYPRFTFSQVARDFRNPGAVLLSLLLFFQFGNEWSIAGWLPLFLIRRLGISPEISLLILALYWAALLVGRLVSQWIIPRVRGGALLAGAVLSALLGTIVLASTNNRFGTVMGILFVAAGYAPVYPLVVQKIGQRFPEYRPGVSNGLFSLAMMGGLLAPWSLGYLASAWGIQAVMILPMAGSCLVFVLTLLIALEAKLSGWAELKGSGF